MSQVMSKIKQFASNFKYKPGESASHRPGQGVRDSILTIEGQTSAGAFTQLIKPQIAYSAGEWR